MTRKVWISADERILTGDWYGDFVKLGAACRLVKKAYYVQNVSFSSYSLVKNLRAAGSLARRFYRDPSKITADFL